MNWEAVGAIGELVGAVAVVATLVYLSLQVRQNTRATKAQAELETTRGRTNWYDLHLTNPDLARNFDQGFLSPESFETGERRIFLWQMASLFSRLDEIYSQYSHGLISDEDWNTYEALIASMLSEDIVMESWKTGATVYSAAFHEKVDAFDTTQVDPSWKSRSLSIFLDRQ